jgi:hypothetical protein
LVIAALPGSKAADDEPDDQNHRSEMHLNLLRPPIAIAGLYISPESRVEAYPYVAIPGPARRDRRHFPEIWKLFPDIWKLPVIC